MYYHQLVTLIHNIRAERKKLKKRIKTFDGYKNPADICDWIYHTEPILKKELTRYKECVKDAIIKHRLEMSAV